MSQNHLSEDKAGEAFIHEFPCPLAQMLSPLTPDLLEEAQYLWHQRSPGAGSTGPTVHS